MIEQHKGPDTKPCPFCGEPIQAAAKKYLDADRRTVAVLKGKN